MRLCPQTNQKSHTVRAYLFPLLLQMWGISVTLLEEGQGEGDQKKALLNQLRATQYHFLWQCSKRERNHLSPGVYLSSYCCMNRLNTDLVWVLIFLQFQNLLDILVIETMQGLYMSRTCHDFFLLQITAHLNYLDSLKIRF